MEQLEQLVGIRDAAEKRLEAARAAIERSPDAKLVASLTLLIDDLRRRHPRLPQLKLHLPPKRLSRKRRRPKLLRKKARLKPTPRFSVARKRKSKP